MPDQLKSGLIRTLYILEDYLDDIVLGGGWVPLIYAHYVVGDRTLYPILTGDIDFMVNNRVPNRGGESIDTMLKDAGLEPQLYGAENKPIVQYVGEIDGHEIIVEFLTNLRGSGDQTIVEVQRGLNAQALRYLKVSTENRMSVLINDYTIYGFENSIEINVPIPGAFVFHKGLVFLLRAERLKKEKDLYYIFNTLQMDNNLYKRIINEINNLNNIPSTWHKKFIRNIKNYFDEITSEGVLAVINQRPANHYPSLNDDQLKNFVYRKFQDFIEKVE